ncbi:MAG: hypothetical protein M3R41_02645 [Pseudomonadota bacterium]|nr:hypothetical protein [Pseudomonadota bacterium]
MRDRLAILLMIAAVAPSCVEAQSQPGASPHTGSLIAAPPAASVNGTTKTDARRAALAFSQCVLKRMPLIGAGILTDPVGTEQYTTLVSKAASSECLEGGVILHMPQILMRAAFFEAAYIQQFRTGPVELKDSPIVDYRAGYSDSLNPYVANTIALAQFGDCVVRAGTSDARAMVLNLPGSYSENRAVAALIPKLAPCVPAGSKVEFSKPVLRGAIAEAIYRLSVASTQNKASN